MKVLLCIPPNMKLARFPLWMPLGLGYLAAAAQSQLGDQISVDILDCPALGIDQDGFGRIVSDKKPDIVGFSFKTLSLECCMIAAREVKKNLPHTIILAGGPQLSGDPSGTMNYIPDLDLGLRGEADETFPALLEELLRGWRPGRSEDVPDVAGLVYMDRSKEVRYGGSVIVDDLDRLPFPAWDLVKPRIYPTKAFFKDDEGKTALIAVTRGCPYRCSFCCIETSGSRTFRRRNLENVMQEISILHSEFGIKKLMLADENLTMDRDYALEFSNRIASLDFPVSWAAMNGLRPDSLDRELLECMRRSGCRLVYVGLESGSETVLSSMEKGFTVREASSSVRLAASVRGLDLGAFFILGYPGETIIERIRTLLHAFRLPLSRAVFLPFAASPGSPIFSQALRTGYIPSWHRGKFIPPAEEGADIAAFLENNRRKATCKKTSEWWLVAAYLVFYLRPDRCVRLLVKSAGVYAGRAIFHVAGYFRS